MQGKDKININTSYYIGTVIFVEYQNWKKLEAEAGSNYLAYLSHLSAQKKRTRVESNNLSKVTEQINGRDGTKFQPPRLFE